MESERPAALTRFAWLSIAAAMVTLVLKLAAWRLTGSVGLMSDAFETLANLGAALITLASLMVAARPADDDHAYGHTKAEYFAGGLEGALIVVAAGGIAWSAVDRLIEPRALQSVGVGLGFSATASAVNLGVARVLFRAGRRHHSVALEADAHHLMTDVWTSSAAIAGVALVAFTGWTRLDPLLGLALAFHIVFTGVRLIRQSMLGLIDTALPADEMGRIQAVLEGFREEGVEYHALRTRRAGARRFMSVHVLVPGRWSVARAHELAEKIESRIRAEVPRLTVLTHLEPVEDPASWYDIALDRTDGSPAEPPADAATGQRPGPA